MKNHVLLLSSLFLFGCASTESLKEAPVCSVWQDQPVLGPKHVKVLDNKVVIKGRCLFYFWGCVQQVTEIDPSGDIYYEGPGIFSSRKKVAVLKDAEVHYEKSMMDSIIRAEPIKLDMTNKTASRVVKVGFLDQSSKDELQMNKACSPSEAAAGSVALLFDANSKH